MISFRPFDELDRRHRGYQSQFLMAFQDWTQLKSDGSGAIVLPPVTLTDAALRTAKTSMAPEFVAGVAGLCGMVGCLFASIDRPSVGPFLLSALFLALSTSTFWMWRRQRNGLLAFERFQSSIASDGLS